MKVSRAAIPNLSAPNEQAHRAMQELWEPPHGITGWLCDTNHKHIGMRYIVTAFVFFALVAPRLLKQVNLLKPRSSHA